jgi:hypothetical protein
MLLASIVLGHAGLVAEINLANRAQHVLLTSEKSDTVQVFPPL